MFFSYLALWVIALSTSVVAQNYPGCKGGLYADIGKAVSSYPPAQTYCSSKFPVPAQTTTIAAPTSTSTSTILTTTTTTGTATVISTVATVTSFTSTTSTSIVTVTSTTTTTVPFAKRGADPTAEKWKSLLSQASAFVGAICTCIEKPKTSSATTTPLATVTTISTQTVSATTTITSSVTATEATLVTVLLLSTTTTTAIATVTAAPHTDYNQCAPVNNFCATSDYSCACYATTGGQGGCAINGGVCGNGCNKDSDCPSGGVPD